MYFKHEKINHFLDGSARRSFSSIRLHKNNTHHVSEIQFSSCVHISIWKHAGVKCSGESPKRFSLWPVNQSIRWLWEGWKHPGKDELWIMWIMSCSRKFFQVYGNKQLAQYWIQVLITNSKIHTISQNSNQFLQEFQNSDITATRLHLSITEEIMNNE